MQRSFTISRLLLFFAGLSLCSTSVAQFDASKFEALDSVMQLPIPTTLEKAGKTRQVLISVWNNLSAEEDEYLCSIYENQIDSALSVQSEYYWNEVYAVYKIRSHQVGDASILYERNAEIARELADTLLLVKAYTSLAQAYFEKKMYDRCLAEHTRILELLTTISDSARLAKSYGVMGWHTTNIAWLRKDSLMQLKASEYLRTAIDYRTSEISGEHFDQGMMLCYSLARSNKHLEAIDLAKYMIKEVVPVTERGYYSRYIDVIAIYSAREGDRDTAIHYLNRTVEWWNQYGSLKETDHLLKIDGYLYNSSIVYAHVEVYQALNMHQKVVEVIDEILFGEFPASGVEIEPFLWQKGSKSYYAIGQKDKGYTCAQNYMRYADSVQLETEKQMSKTIETYTNAQVYLTEKKAKEAEEQQMQISREQQKTKNVILGAVVVGATILVVFLFILFKRFKKTRKQKEIIEEQKVQVDRAFVALEEKNLEIVDSISYAKRIQEAYLPHPDLLQQLVPSSFLLFKPKDIVSCDFYWYYTSDPENSDGDVFIAAADCTGHGVPGAIMSVVCCNAINKVVVNNGKRNTGNILDEVRDEVIQILTTRGDNQRKDGMDIAFARMNKKTGLVQYSGAHNPLWVVKKGAEEIFEVKADKQPIGAFEKKIPFAEHEVQLEKGDSFYLFSDGFADQFGGEKGKKFKTANFKRLLLSIQDKPMDEQRHLLDEAFENWRGSIEQLDDVCVIGVRY